MSRLSNSLYSLVIWLLGNMMIELSAEQQTFESCFVRMFRSLCKVDVAMHRVFRVNEYWGLKYDTAG